MDLRGRHRLDGHIATVTIDRVLLGIVSHPAAGHFVVPQRDIDTSPEVLIADRLGRAEVFPAEIVLSPFDQPVLQTASDVAIRGDQGDFARLIEGFEPSDHGHEGDAIGVEDGFVIPGFRFKAVFDVFQDESPSACIVLWETECLSRCAFAEQQKMGLDRGNHASLGSEC